MFWPLWPPSGNTQLCTKYLKESKSTENYKKKWDINNVLECCVEDPQQSRVDEFV